MTDTSKDAVGLHAGNDLAKPEHVSLLCVELRRQNDHYTANTIDALAAKLAEVEEMKRLLAMDKINLRAELAGVQGRLAALEDDTHRQNDNADTAENEALRAEGRFGAGE